MSDAPLGSKAAATSCALNPPYVHEPLRTDVPAFRVVKILPREGLDYVRCEVINTDIGTALEYKALSYVWGPRSPVQDVELNGMRLAVRQNLWDFLDLASTETDPDGVNWIFIDQICIDQENVLERNHQVQQMAEIYRRAKQVVIWIKPKIPISKNWSESMKDLNSHDPAIRGSKLDECEELASDRYWRRLWVVQEVILARTVIVRWGLALINLSEFRHVWAKSDSRAENAMQGLIVAQSDFWLDEFGMSPWTWFGWKSLQMAIVDKECEDPRDQVYALLGLVQPTEIRPDYSKSVEEVFQDWAQDALKHGEWMPTEILRCRKHWREQMKLPVETVPEDVFSFEMQSKAKHKHRGAAGHFRLESGRRPGFGS